MKQFSTLLLFIAILTFSISCSQNKKPEKVKKLVNDIIQIEPDKLSGTEPITQLDKIAAEKADKTIMIYKENIAQSLEEAHNYNKILIVVGTHTLIKIVNLDDCQKSNAWGTCMPKGIALIQKSGSFEKETGYINNFIGMPDGQTRKMYLFK